MEENKITKISPIPVIPGDTEGYRIIRNDIPKKKINDEDLQPIINNVEKAKAVKKSKGKSDEKKPSTSVKPLKFDPNPDDSIMKDLIVKVINSRDLTYSDLYNYCTSVKAGDVSEGQKLGYNIISGLRHRRSMMDTTFSLLCDFLNLDIVLIDRKEDSEDLTPDPEVADFPAWDETEE